MKTKNQITVNDFIDSLECCDSEKLFDVNWFNNMIIKIKLKID